MYEFKPEKIKLDRYLANTNKNIPILTTLLFFEADGAVVKGQEVEYQSWPEDEIKLFKLLEEDKLVKLKVVKERKHQNSDVVYSSDVKVKYLDVYSIRLILSFLLSSNEPDIEPYGMDKQYSDLKQKVYSKYLRYENRNILFKADEDVGALSRRHYEIFGVLSFMEKMGSIKIEEAYYGYPDVGDQNGEKSPFFSEAKIFITDKFIKEQKMFEEEGDQPEDPESTVEPLRDYEWRCSSCTNHLANIKEVLDGKIEKKCHKCKTNNLLNVKDGKIV